MSYFSQSKSEPGPTGSKADSAEAKSNTPTAPRRSPQDIVSTIASGMLVKGDIVCSGAMQIYGRVIGDIHVARLLICKGAHVEGKITAQDVSIEGTFKGTIRSNSVKLQAAAAVEGEIFNKSLAIEQDALFEGMSRRLEAPVDAPSADQVNGDQPAAALVPDSATAG